MLWITFLHQILYQYFFAFACKLCYQNYQTAFEHKRVKVFAINTYSTIHGHWPAKLSKMSLNDCEMRIECQT